MTGRLRIRPGQLTNCSTRCSPPELPVANFAPLLQGFAFPKLSQLKSTPPFFTMVSRSLLVQNTFSFWFSADVSEEPAGELFLGGVNPDRLVGDATFVAVPSNT